MNLDQQKHSINPCNLLGSISARVEILVKNVLAILALRRTNSLNRLKSSEVFIKANATHLKEWNSVIGHWVLEHSYQPTCLNNWTSVEYYDVAIALSINENYYTDLTSPFLTTLIQKYKKIKVNENNVLRVWACIGYSGFIQQW